MDDFGTWLYIIGGILYFIIRQKKKKGKDQPEMPNSENRPQRSNPTKTFEELLKEITEGGFSEVQEEPNDERVETEVLAPEATAPSPKPAYMEEGRTRSFADDESKRVYEESIKRAEGADLEFKPDDDYAKPSLFQKYTDKKTSSPKNTLASEIRKGLKGSGAKKAIIYAEILNRKY